MDRDTRLQGIWVPLENLIKIPLNEKALGKKCTSMFPQNGAPMEVDANFREKKCIWVPFLDPEDIKILRLGAIFNCGKGTGLY
jgi:hypothetical protein